MRLATRARARLIPAAASSILAAALLIATASPASAATIVRRTWTGALSGHGTAALTATTDGKGSLATHLTGLAPKASYPIGISNGWCGSAGTSLIKLASAVDTSDSKLYVYTVTRVVRHVSSLNGVFGITTGQLWLQTSEGPSTTSTKVIVRATLTSVSDTTYAASHPKARPTICH